MSLEERVIRKSKQEIRRQSRAEVKRILNNVVAHRPWWLPMFLWRKMVAVVLDYRGDPQGK